MMILIGIYFAYYGLNLVFDLLNSGQRPTWATEDDSVLHFTEDEPELIIPAKQQIETPASMGPADSSAQTVPSDFPGSLASIGAVSLKKLFELAKDDLILYYRSISY